MPINSPMPAPYSYQMPGAGFQAQPMLQPVQAQQPQMFQQQFQGNPQQNNYQSMVQGMMNNGTMSQQQFEQCRQMANMLTGKNY